MTPRQYQPSPEERDEPVNTEEEAADLIRSVLKAGPHPEDDEKRRTSRKRSRPRD